MDNRKTILILGAGSDQIYPIKIAREMGYRTLVVDINPKSKGFEFCDEYRLVSNRDVKSIKELCDLSQENGHKISSVFLMGSDIPNIQSEIAKYLSLTGPSEESAKFTTNKFLMKERLYQKGISIPWYKLVRSLDDTVDAIKKSSFEKYVIKPVDRSGARGVFLFERNSPEIKNLFNIAKKESLSGDLLIEEYIPGDQISTESIIFEGKAYTPGFVDRNYEMLDRFSPHIIENGGNHPSKIKNSIRKKVYELVEKAALALGIYNGNAKGDVVINSKGQPLLIEMASRLSGGDFSESLIPLGSGVNIVKESINLSLGEKVNTIELRDKFTKYVANRYFFTKPGYINLIKIAINLEEVKWLKKFELFYKEGDYVEAITSHASRVGVFVVVADTKEILEKRIELIYEKVKIIIGEKKSNS